MFMRFRGGGVGHVGTHYLDSRLKEDNQEPDDDHQDETALEEVDEDIDEDIDMEEDDGAGVGEDSEQELSGNVNNDSGQDTDDSDDLEDKETMNDDEILSEAGFAELWDIVK